MTMRTNPRGHLSPTTVAAALSAMLLCTACHAKPSSADPPPDIVRDGQTITVNGTSPLRTHLEFDTARITTIRPRVSATATVEADPARIVRILPPMAGRVLALHVRLGDAVTQGQPLFTLDSPDYAAALSDYARSQTASKQAMTTLTRQRDLADHGIAARRDVEQAETDFALANDDLRRARARLASLGVDPDRGPMSTELVVRSPITGRVVDLGIGQGEFHNDPNTSLASVADLAVVWLTANVQERDVQRVAAGQEAHVVFTAYPGDTVHGRILSVGDFLDPDTRTTKVRVALANASGRYKPGMFAVVNFESAVTGAVTVPATAVLQVGDTSYVFVETKPWTFTRLPVTIGASFGDRVAITSGLVGGERVVARQVVLLQ